MAHSATRLSIAATSAWPITSRTLKLGDPGVLAIYDEFRFISGASRSIKIWDIVCQFGKLSGEKIYNKRIFPYAKLHRGNKKTRDKRHTEAQ